MRAAAAGRVVFAGWNGAYGLLIILEHKNFRTYYAHNSSLLVEKDQQVAAGEIIATIIGNIIIKSPDFAVDIFMVFWR